MTEAHKAAPIAPELKKFKSGAPNERLEDYHRKLKDAGWNIPEGHRVGYHTYSHPEHPGHSIEIQHRYNESGPGGYARHEITSVLQHYVAPKK